MKGFPTQKERVLAFLQDGKAISTLGAIKYFGAMRLSAIIFALREEGAPIVSVRKKDPTGTPYVSYRMSR